MEMTRLSVNINKVATLRNARGGSIPDVLQFALDCEKYGADGITVHPRPDERHIRKEDVVALKEKLTVELNVEGYPSADFLNLVCFVQPAQVTLVPDAPEQLTSDTGWDTEKHFKQLKDIVERLKKAGIRTSIFVNPDYHMVEYADLTGTDCIELYTESFAREFNDSPRSAIKPYIEAAEKATELKIGINAGHDLNLANLRYFAEAIPGLLEVSIGHALISDSLYYGLESTIRQYKNLLEVEREKKTVNEG